MIAKDFGGWHVRKLALNSLNSNRYYYEREVWWAAIGHNVGSEEDGKGANFARPVLVVRKFNQSLFFGLPLSTTLKSGKYYFPLVVAGVANNALLSQLRAYDTKRLVNKLDVIDEMTYDLLLNRLSDIIKPPLARG